MEGELGVLVGPSPFDPATIRSPRATPRSAADPRVSMAQSRGQVQGETPIAGHCGRRRRDLSP
eukprot:5906199-Pyramimonas_sp.AAC.1